MDIGGDGVEHNEGDQPSNLNISDVLDAIVVVETCHGEGAALEAPAGGDSAAGGATQETMSRPVAPAGAGVRPYVRIVEQPAGKALRFRYICEGRSAGSIPGINSTQDRRTFPTIEICDYVGKVIIVVSCVTKDAPYKPHPHNLVGRDHCSKGVCSMKMDVTPENRTVSFSNLGIQCVKKRDIAEALSLREKQRVDPFRTGFNHITALQSVDLNAVRLCFQVFIVGPDGECRRGLSPVVSDIIYDKKAMSDLHILRTSCTAGSAKGGTEVILLCEKVTREDTAVVMYQEGADGTVEWEANANIIMVHKQVAIAFSTPPYRDPATRDHVTVYMQLKRVTGNERSNSVMFQYVPETQEMDYLKRKRQKTSLLQQIEQERATYEQTIKSEPSDKCSPLHVGSSPVRYNPHDQMPHENLFNQQWMPDLNVAGGSNVNFSFNPDMQWQGSACQVPMQPNMSPNMQARSPMHMTNMPVTSPNIQLMSPHVQVMSPHGQVLSPHGQVMSPHGQVMSPHRQVMSPQGQVMSPQGQVMSPQGHVMQDLTRQGHVMQSVSPGIQMLSSQGPVMSPQGQVMLGQGQIMSPQGQIMSPQGQVMSPQGQVMSLQGHMMSPQLTVDTDRCGVSPGMGHISPNMGHVSPAMQQQQPMAQPMEQNSVSSIANYLMDRGGDNINSGEIAMILGLRHSDVSDPPNDLSDSLNRLSTSELLPGNLLNPRL